MIFQRYVFLKSESKSKLAGGGLAAAHRYFKDTFFLKVKANQNLVKSENRRFMIFQRYVFLKSESKSKRTHSTPHQF